MNDTDKPRIKMLWNMIESLKDMQLLTFVTTNLFFVKGEKQRPSLIQYERNIIHFRNFVKKDKYRNQSSEDSGVATANLQVTWLAVITKSCVVFLI